MELLSIKICYYLRANNHTRSETIHSLLNRVTIESITDLLNLTNNSTLENMNDLNILVNIDLVLIKIIENELKIPMPFHYSGIE